MVALKERRYTYKIPYGSHAIIGADIGGTNSNFGIFDGIKSKPQLLFSLHTKSQHVKDFSLLVQQVISFVKKTYSITIDQALFACAGVVSAHKDASRPTNLNIVIDVQDIKKKTGLQNVYIANDFEVIGYGINLIHPKDLVEVNKGISWKHANKAIVGAGTGVGKCIMFYNNDVGRYVPVVSEGGHEDAALQHLIELELVRFIQEKERFSCNISWEDLLSGNGIKRIYSFFHKNALNTDHQIGEHIPHPDEIFNSRMENKHSADTFNLYATLYARCVKNFALDALALGGIYIAGGIAAHNVPMFQMPLFFNEFIKCGKLSHLLKDIPVYIIADYNVSLYGAAYYLYLENI